VVEELEKSLKVKFAVTDTGVRRESSG